MISSVCDGVSTVCSRKLSMENSHWMTQGFWYGAASMMFSPLAGFGQNFVVIEKSNVWLVSLFFGIGLSGIFAEVTFGYATTREEGAILGVLSNASLIFSLIWQQTIFRTNITWYQGVAVACIIIASVVCAAEKKYYEWRNGAVAAPSSPNPCRSAANRETARSGSARRSRREAKGHQAHRATPRGPTLRGTWQAACRRHPPWGLTTVALKMRGEGQSKFLGSNGTTSSSCNWSVGAHGDCLFDFPN